MIPKAQRTLNLLCWNLSDCSQNTKDVACKTLVCPVLEYANTSWDLYQANHIHRADNVQRRATHFVTGAAAPGTHQRHCSHVRPTMEIAAGTLSNCPPLHVLQGFEWTCSLRHPQTYDHHPEENQSQPQPSPTLTATDSVFFHAPSGTFYQLKIWSHSRPRLNIIF